MESGQLHPTNGYSLSCNTGTFQETHASLEISGKPDRQHVV